jgi:ATPase family associated with various cellular activities (AAA)
MGNKYSKIDRFKSVIPAKYLPEEILKINEISLKSYFAEQVNLEFANIWSLRAQSKPENFDAILQALKNKELLNFFKSFFKSFRKSWAYYFLPGWVFLGWFRIFRNQELLILVRQKYDLAVYFHRLRVNKKLRSIQVDRGVILTFFIFAFSAIQYIFARFKPLINPYILVNNLPLFCYPIETIKWESLMSSEIAQRILVEEDNKIDLFDDYLLIRRNKELNLFGHIYLKDSDDKEFWIWKPKEKKKLSQIFYDLDELPKYLESSYAPTEEKPDLSDAELKEFLDSNTSLEFKELFNKKALTSKRQTEINQIIRDQYALSIGHLNFTSILHRANEKNLNLFKDRAEYIKKYSNEELEESVRIKEFYSLIPDKDLEPFILKYPRTAFQKLQVDQNVEDLNTLDKKWGTSKNFRNKKSLNKNNSIISIRNDEFFKKYNKKNISSTSLKDKKEINETIVNINSNDSKETEALNNQPSSSFDQINIDLSFIKNPKLYSKLDNLFKNNKELFINVVDHFYNFKSRNKNSKVYIKPRKMSGYRYPDLNSKEIKLLLLKDFLFQNKETDIVQIELPPDLVFTNSFLLNYPKAPDTKNLKIASAKPLKTIKYESLENLPDADLDELEDPNDPDNLAILKDSKYDVSLANNLETKYLVDYDPDVDENQQEQEQEQEDEAEEYDPGTLEVNYKGPAALVNESNDIRVLYDARNKNVKPYISRSKDSRLIINVPFSYFTGSMNIDSLKKSLRKPDNKESIPETNLETKDLENTEKKNTINNEGIATENSKNHIKDEYTIPEENALRPWLLNYYSPDNPLTSTDVAFSDDTFEKLNRKNIRKAKKADPTLLEAFYEEEIDLKISKRAIYSDKKWKFFPYAEEIDDEEESDYIPLIPSKKNVILIGINSEGWESRQPIEKDFLPFLDEIASNTELEDEETVTMSGLEVHHYTNELMGYAIAELPTADIFVPEPKEIPNLEFGLVNEIDYSPLVRALFRKITTFHFDLYTRRLLNDTFGNHLVSNKRQRFKTRSTRKHRNKRKRKGKTTNILTRYLKKPWEPLTANSWLVISQFWFAYICCIIFKETAFNYGREFVSFILELISQGGFIPPMVIDELKILIGEKDPGFRIARDFTKGFRDLVGIDNLGNKLLDTLLFLRGAISNPLIAKNAQSLLLVGPPGTGKTLLVHALAHEAKVPVLTLSAQGSQEPASLERCFQEARRLAPCIVFLDEIDSMAQKRSLIIGEGDFYDNANNEEAGRRPSNYSMESEMSTVVGDLDPRLLQNKEALHMVVNRDVQNYLIDKNDREYYRIGMLSKLLTELDGVETTDGVVIIGATNRVEVLDPALLRPGRFYKHVRIGLPNKIKRMQLFNFYSDILGSDPTIPWDYLVNVTYGFSAADIATIMNESSIRAIANASLHTLETIEYGIDRITTINIDKPFSNKINNIKKEFSFSTVRSAYYQAGKALLGTLLKYHPPIRVVHLWYRENSVRYNQILKTIQLEWLSYVFRGELEHRIIGAYGGKVGEFFFLQYQDEAIDELNISTMGSQDWVIGQNLIRLLVDKWHLYAQNTLFQEQPAIKTHFNDEEFNDIREQYLYEFSQIYENTPTATNLMGFHADKNPQTRYPLSWWQMKIYEQYLLDELQKWFSVWLDDPEEWKLNIHWVPPDRTFHQNPFLEKITEIIKVDDFTSLVNDYQIHSIVMEAFNLGVVVLDEYRELLDELVYELLAEEILREHTIYEICTNFGIDCDNLKEDLYNSEIKIEPLPQFKILYPSWGVDSAKPTIRWIDIAAITGETPDYGPEKSNEDLDESLTSDEKINKDLEKPNITIDDAVESMKKEITDTDDVTTETSSENINKNLEEAGASENENEEAITDEDEKEEKKQIHILSTFYPNIIKENSYIFPKKEIEPPLDSSSNEENQ